MASRLPEHADSNHWQPDPTTSRFQELADAYPDGIVGFDRDGIVTVINRQAAALLRVPSARPGSPVAEVLRLRDRADRHWLDVNDPFGGINIRRGIPEQAWLTDGGDEVLTTARLLRYGPGKPVRGVAVAVRSGRGRAILDRERSDLVATVAHELRSPLTGVKGFVQALLNRWDRLSDDQRKLMLMTVSSDADRLARLISELLDVARIDTGRLQLYPRPSSAEVLVGRVVDSFTAGGSRTISLDAEPDLPLVFADPDKFVQVVTNLVENAIRHGEGEVEVSVRRHDAHWPGVRILVRDHGPGIAPEMRRRVFTKFWKSGDSGGTGLGMYIVGGLTRAHGGVVTIEDAGDGGACVSLDWPLDDRRSL